MCVKWGIELSCVEFWNCVDGIIGVGAECLRPFRLANNTGLYSYHGFCQCVMILNHKLPLDLQLSTISSNTNLDIDICVLCVCDQRSNADRIGVS